MTIKEARKFGKAELEEAKSPSSGLDCDVLLQEVLNCDKTHLIFKSENLLTPEQEQLFLSYINKRKTLLPVAYILNRKEFYGYSFYVDQNVLIPKPDTEILVENCTDYLAGLVQNKKNSGAKKLKVLDLCTGSGCVGITVYLSLLERLNLSPEEMPSFELADISEKALDVAKKNTLSLIPLEHQCNFTHTLTNLFSDIKGKFNLIASNPPYIPHDESVELLTDGRSEPILALDGDIDLEGNPTGKNDGLGIIGNLVYQAKSHLADGCLLALETGEYNAEQTKIIMEENGYTDCSIDLDLEGQMRNVMGFFNL